MFFKLLGDSGVQPGSTGLTSRVQAGNGETRMGGGAGKVGDTGEDTFLKKQLWFTSH